MRISLAVFATVIALGQDPPRGKVVDPVACALDAGQSYAVYVPSGYTPDRAWPVLYCLDPVARGRLPVERFAKAAEAHGVIVVGSNNSRNGPIAPSQAAIRAMLIDTGGRFHLDPDRVFATGFSGGARLALGWALNGHIRGVIAGGAGFSSPNDARQASFPMYLVAGVDDFNHSELFELSLELTRRKVPHRFADFAGSHEWLPESLADEALAFLLGKLPPKPAEDTKEARRIVDRFNEQRARFIEADPGGRRDIASRALQQSAAAEDSVDRRVARRLLGDAFVGGMEQGHNFIARKDYPAAAKAYEIAVLVRPEAANAWYALAVAAGAMGDKRRALEALKEAVGKGFRDWPRVEAEPLLEKVRKDPRYRAITQPAAP